MISKKTYFIVLSFLISTIFSSCRKGDVVVDIYTAINDNGSGTGTVTWTKDKNYMLDGFVFVNPGQVLTIEPGTVIRAKTGQGENASALIVARGAKIIAKGTAQEPIIFTVEGDDLKGSIPVEARGLWGGLIILGNAQLNNEFNEAKIEGIPLSESRGIYGGTINNDNSGILKYVSIRHGGTNIGEGNEINGLTMGGVGSETSIEYVEVISNEDDGFEFFGGSVNCKHLVSAFCGDDAFDFDQGYQGNLQFLLAIQASSLGSNLAEHGGNASLTNATPFTIPKIYNATYIGNGQLQSSDLINFSNNGAGKYYNSIFLNQLNGVKIEYTNGTSDSFNQFQNNNLIFENNIFYDIEANNNSLILSAYNSSGDPLYPQQMALQNYLFRANNNLYNPGIEISENTINILPTGNVNTHLANYPSLWFDTVNYKGAFDPNGDNWLNKWTLVFESGKLQH
ncbi:MAG: hypothetical protein MI739_14745 [Bacteroidales bacterium]|nr:hypothetical protein [Bacteroidales bacterium]